MIRREGEYSMREFHVNLFFKKILRNENVDVSATRSAMMDIAISVENLNIQKDFPKILLFRHLISHGELTQKSKTLVFTELACLDSFQREILMPFGGRQIGNLLSISEYWNEVSKLCELMGVKPFKELDLSKRKYFLDRVALALAGSKISIENSLKVCGVLDINQARSFLKVPKLMHAPYSLEIGPLATRRGSVEEASYEVNAYLRVFGARNSIGPDIIYQIIWETDIVTGFVD